MGYTHRLAGWLAQFPCLGAIGNFAGTAPGNETAVIRVTVRVINKPVIRTVRAISRVGTPNDVKPVRRKLKESLLGSVN